MTAQITIIQFIRSIVAIVAIIAAHSLANKYIDHLIQKDKEYLEFEKRTWEETYNSR